MKKKLKLMQAYRIDVPPEGEFEDFRDKKRINYLQSEYDENGNSVEEVKFDGYGDVIGKSVYVYDDKGHLIGEETYDDSDDLEEKLSYERDGNGRLIKEYVHYLDGAKDTILYKYNDDGKLVYKVLNDEDGDLEKEEKIEYFGGFIVGEEVIEDGELVRKNKFTIDEKGNVLKAEVKTEDEEFRLVNEYDENGNRIKQLKYDNSDKLVEKHEYKYDGNNRMIETMEENPYKKTTTILGYDEHGNPTTQKEVNRDGSTNHELERDYDEDGNVTEVRAAISGQGQAPARKYILIYEYGFFE